MVDVEVRKFRPIKVHTPMKQHRMKVNPYMITSVFLATGYSPFAAYGVIVPDRVVRPWEKLIAVIFSAIALLLIIIGVSVARWVDVKFQAGDDAWQAWGLWEECYTVISGVTVCMQKEWMQAAAAMTMLALFAAIGALGLGILGLCTHRRVVYIIAGVLAVFGALFLLIAIIIFPVKFSEEMQSVDRNKLEKWEFDWTWGLTLGGMFFLIGAAAFFFIPAENQEIDRSRSECSCTMLLLKLVAPHYYHNSSRR